jgi:hypothetical protein
MSIDVTRGTALLEPEKRLMRMVLQCPFDFGRGDQPVDVTLFALEQSVFACQRKSGFRVIELRPVELSDLRFLPKMLLVTGDTGAPCGLEVIPSPGVDGFFDLSVTSEALCPAYFLTALVTLRAV